ncbi:MAG TPA: hypothetical protein VGP62_23910 [Bryobacteraceae bacterium]|nr:hypothetical protein [Bryobacteraceae bacterium]
MVENLPIEGKTPDFAAAFTSAALDKYADDLKPNLDPVAQESASSKEIVGASIKEEAGAFQPTSASAKLAIADKARSTISKFERPPDVGCAMSILSWSETRYAFGAVVANEYIAVQVVVRNLNATQDFLLHDIEMAVDADPDGRHGRFFSGRDRVIARALSVAQQDYSVRNLIVHSLEGVGTLMSAVIPIAGTTFSAAAGVYNSGFLTGLRSTWKDLTTDQVTLISDYGFSASSTYKTLVPKSGSAMLVTFIPSRQFEEGWWTQPCAQYIFVDQKPKDKLSNVSSVGLDLHQALGACRQEAGLSGTKAPQGYLAPVRKRYKDWTGLSAAIFRELSFAVVAGTHIEEQTQTQPTISELDCPTDASGNILFSKAVGDSVICSVTGLNLDKVSKLKLRNAQDATDTATAEGTVTTSGDPKSAKVAFPLAQLGPLNKPAYKLYSVTKDGVEAVTNQTVHLDLNPFLTVIDPTQIAVDASPQPSLTINLSGFHLDKANEVALSDPTHSKNVSVDQPASAADSSGKASFKLDSTVISWSPTTLSIALVTKPSTGTPTNITTDKTLKLTGKPPAAAQAPPAAQPPPAQTPPANPGPAKTPGTKAPKPKSKQQ